MLKMDPADRISAIEALAHPYFDNMRDAESEELVENFRNGIEPPIMIKP